MCPIQEVLRTMATNKIRLMATRPACPARCSSWVGLLAIAILLAVAAMAPKRGRGQIKNLAELNKEMGGVNRQRYKEVKEELVKGGVAKQFLLPLGVAICKLPEEKLPPHMRLADAAVRKASPVPLPCLPACRLPPLRRLSPLYTMLDAQCGLLPDLQLSQPQTYDMWKCGAPVFIVDGRGGGWQRVNKKGAEDPNGTRMEVPVADLQRLLNTAKFPCTVVTAERLAEEGRTPASCVVMAYAPGEHVASVVPPDVLAAIKAAHLAQACWCPLVDRKVAAGAAAGMSGFRQSQQDAKASNEDPSTAVGRWGRELLCFVCSSSGGSCSALLAPLCCSALLALQQCSPELRQ